MKKNKLIKPVIYFLLVVSSFASCQVNSEKRNTDTGYESRNITVKNLLKIKKDGLEYLNTLVSQKGIRFHGRSVLPHRAVLIYTNYEDKDGHFDDLGVVLKYLCDTFEKEIVPSVSFHSDWIGTYRGYKKEIIDLGYHFVKTFPSDIYAKNGRKVAAINEVFLDQSKKNYIFLQQVPENIYTSGVPQGINIDIMDYATAKGFIAGLGQDL